MCSLKKYVCVFNFYFKYGSSLFYTLIFFLNIKFNNNTKQKLEIISGYTNLNKIIDFESKKKKLLKKKSFESQ